MVESEQYHDARKAVSVVEQRGIAVAIGDETKEEHIKSDTYVAPEEHT